MENDSFEMVIKKIVMKILLADILVFVLGIVSSFIMKGKLDKSLSNGVLMLSMGLTIIMTIAILFIIVITKNHGEGANVYEDMHITDVALKFKKTENLMKVLKILIVFGIIFTIISVALNAYIIYGIIIGKASEYININMFSSFTFISALNYVTNIFIYVVTLTFGVIFPIYYFLKFKADKMKSVLDNV